MAGRRTISNFLIENRQLFPKIIPQRKHHHLFVYVEPLDLTEENLAGYLSLMGDSLLNACQREGIKSKKWQALFKEETASYSQLLQQLKKVIREIISLGYKITFFLGEFDELDFAKRLFYNNLKSLWSAFQPKFTCVFLVREDVATPVKTAKHGELNEALLQNVVFIPMERESISYMIKRNEMILRHTFSDKEKKIIEMVCGSHPFLLKAATRIVALQDGKKKKEKKLEEFLLEHYQLRSAAQKILGLRTEEEKGILMRVAKGEKVNLTSRAGDSLVKSGLIFKKSDKKLYPFSLLFQKAILHATKKPAVTPTKKPGLSFDEKTGLIIYGSRSIEEQFTRQEYDLLSLFLKEPNKLHSRDRIGEVLWGEESYEKYSNWAIDQIISKIRKKLKKLGIENSLLTLRGRGYKFIQSR